MRTLTELAIERLDLIAQRDDLDGRIKTIDAQILAAAQPGDTLTDPEGNPVWTIKKGAAKWDATKARDILTPEQQAAAEITETKLDPKIARSLLPPALYSLCTSAGRPSIVKASR